MENNNELVQFLILRNESLAEEIGFEKGKQRVINIAVNLLKNQMESCEEEEEEKEEDGDNGFERFSRWLDDICDKINKLGKSE